MPEQTQRARAGTGGAPTGGVPSPVSPARRGFTPEQVAAAHAAWEWRDVLRAGDASLYGFLHFSEFVPSAVVRRSGPVVPLDRSSDARVGAVRPPSGDGAGLDEYLAGPHSRAQGMIVVHRGRIAFERYPGMREDDYHVTMSVAKPLPALVVALLAEEGKIDVRDGLGSHVPELRGTAWDGVRLADVLNMTSGLDVEETAHTRDDPRSTFNRFLRAVLNVPGPAGAVERHTEVIRSATKIREPGRAYEYSSINTQVLVLLAQAVERRPWAEVFRERVWSKVNAEGDLQVCVSPDGVALPFGFVSVRLRDLARLGMLYTPSWDRAARAPVVTPAIVEKIRAGVPVGHEPAPPSLDAPAYSSWQWERVFADGAFYKGGLHGQGLYVSPARDLVIAWFSTAPASELPTYALAVAGLYEPAGR